MFGIHLWKFVRENYEVQEVFPWLHGKISQLAKVNGNASSVWLASLSLFPDVPSNPYSVRLSAVSQRLATVTFMKPDSHGGVPISYYLVQYKEVGSLDWRDVKSHSVQSKFKALLHFLTECKCILWKWCKILGKLVHWSLHKNWERFSVMTAWSRKEIKYDKGFDMFCIQVKSIIITESERIYVLSSTEGRLLGFELLLQSVLLSFRCLSVLTFNLIELYMYSEVTVGPFWFSWNYFSTEEMVLVKLL